MPLIYSGFDASKFVKAYSQSDLTNILGNYLDMSNYYDGVSSLASEYCMRDEYFVQTENQASQGLGYAFAGTNALSSTLMKATNMQYNFSEGWISLAMNYAFNHGECANLINAQKFAMQNPNYSYKAGNPNFFWGFDEIARNYGLVFESDLAFEHSFQFCDQNVDQKFDFYKGYANKNIMNNVKGVKFPYYLNAPNKEDIIKSMKQHILNNGSIYAGFYYNGLTESTVNSKKVYFKTPSTGNYVKNAFSIIGWDDNITQTINGETFTGAWICLNSKGNSNSIESGIDGIVYVFYDDTDYDDYFFGYYYQKTTDGLNLALTNSNANLTTNLKGKYYSNFESSENQTKQKNVFYKTNINLEYSFNGTISGVKIFKDNIDVTNKFEILITNSQNKFSVASKDALDYGEYKLVAGNSKTETTCQFFVNSGLEINYVTYETNIEDDYITNNGYYDLFNSYSNTIYDFVSHHNKTDKNVNPTINLVFATYSDIADIVSDNENVTITKNLEANTCSVTFDRQGSYYNNNFTFSLVSSNGQTKEYKVILTKDNGGETVIYVHIDLGDNQKVVEKHLGTFESSDDDDWVDSVYLENPTKEGYRFEGYYFSKTFAENTKLSMGSKSSYLMCDSNKIFNKSHVTQGEYLSLEFQAHYSKICEVFVYAKWQKTYKISFEAPQATSTDHTKEVNLKYGDYLPNVVPPTRNGYTFVGYFTASGEQYYGAPFTGNWNYDKGAHDIWCKYADYEHYKYKLQSDLTLYARWSVENYEAWFVGDINEDGKLELIDKITYNINTKFKIPYIEVAGYRINYWNTDFPKTDIDGNYDLNSGCSYIPLNDNWGHGKKIYAPISQWDNGGEVYENKYGNIWFVASLEKITYRLTLEVPSGMIDRIAICQTEDGTYSTEDISVETEYGKTYTFFVKLTRPDVFPDLNYKIYYGLDADINVSLFKENIYKIEVSNIKHGGEISVGADGENWRAQRTYRVEHYQQNKNLTGYDLVESKKIDVSNAGPNTEVSVTPYSNTENAQYEYFVFDPTVEGTKTSGKVGYGDLVLKCFYNRKTFNITYIIDGEDVTSEYSPTTFAYEQYVTLPKPTKDGYTFVGWKGAYSSDDETMLEDIQILNSGLIWTTNATLSGTFVKDEKRTVTVYHYMESLTNNAGNGRVQFTSDVGNFYYDLADVEYNKTLLKNSSAYVNDLVKSDINGFYALDYVLSSNEVKIFYNRITYTLTLEKTEGIEKLQYAESDGSFEDYSGALIFKYGQQISLKAILSENYKFVRWEDVNGALGSKPQQTISFAMPSSNIEYRAVAKLSKKVNYTVNYFTENIGVENPDEANEAHWTKFATITAEGEVESLTNVVASEKDGFSLKPIVQKEILEDGSTVVNVYYYRNSYTIDFVFTPNQNIQSINYEFGTSFDLPTFSLEGYKFDAWYENSDYTGTKLTKIEATNFGNKTLYGRFVESDETPFVVNHYIESLEQSVQANNIYFENKGYYELYAAQNLTGVTNQTVYPDVLDIAGFSAPSKQSLIILGDGSAKLDLFYSRNSYTLSLSKSKGIANVNGSGTYKFEEEIMISASVLNGYGFDSFVDAETLSVISNLLSASIKMPAKDFEIIAKALPNQNTIYVVNYYKENIGIENPDINNKEHFALFASKQFVGETDSLTNVEPEIENGFRAMKVTQQKILGDNSTVVNVYYLRETFTVTFSLENATKEYNLPNLQYEFGTTLTLPNLEQVGYDFDAWYDNSEYKGIKTMEINSTDFGNKTMFGRFLESDFIPYTINHYTESLIQQAGDDRILNSATGLYYDLKEVENLLGTTNLNVEASTMNFVGFTAPSTQSKKIESDGTTRFDYYYSRNEYNLSLNSVEGVNLQVLGGKFKFETKINIKAELLAGYSFAGFIDENLTNLSKNLEFVFEMPANDITITATANPNTNTKYIVNFYTQNLNVEVPDENESSHWTKVDSKEMTGTTNTQTNVKPENLYGFDTKTVSQQTILGDESTVVNVYYLRKTLTLVVETSNGISSTSGSGTYKFGEFISVGCVLKVGYSWKHWYDNINYVVASDNKDYNFTMPGINLTLKAVASPNTNTKYVVNYYTENFNVLAPDESDPSHWTKIDTKEMFGETDKTTEITAPNMEGFSAKTISQKQILGDESTVINVYYLRNSYTITLSKTTGITSVDGGGTFEFGAPFEINCTVEIGYEFSLWKGEIDYDKQSLSGNMPATNLNLQAQAVLKQYTVEFDNSESTNEGTVEEETYTLSSKDKTIKITCPTRAGYTLKSLQISGNVGSAYLNNAKTRLTIKAGTYGDIVITPTWEVKTYTITINVNDANFGSVDKTKLEAVPYGSEISINGNELTINGITIIASANASTNRYSYSFVNFSYTSLFVGQNLTFTANFERITNSYSITWKNFDGTILYVDKINFGLVPKYEHDTPFRPDDNEFIYIFDGWTPDVENVRGDAEYTAKFKKEYKQYKVEWRDFDDKILKETYHHYNTLPSFGGVPTRKGYTFAGWTPELNPVLEETVYYAQYTVNHYQITFKTESGEIDGDTTRQIEYGKFIGSLPEIKNGRGTFVGWFLPDGTQVDENTIFDIDGDVVITAKFKSDFGTFIADYWLYIIIGIGGALIIAGISAVCVKAHKSKHKKRGYYGANRPKPPFKR